MDRFRCQVLLLLLSALCTSCGAGEPVPVPDKALLQPQATRPYKDLRDVLFYETFERPVPFLSNGKVVSEDPGPPGGHIVKMEAADWGKADHVVWANMSFRNTPLVIPHGLNPTQLFVQFSIWTDETGELTMKFIHAKGDYQHVQAGGLKAKTWTPITLKLSDLHNKNQHAEIDQLITEFQIILKPPKSKKDIPRAYIDDVLFTHMTNPNDVRPRLLLAEKKRADVERYFERDGFVFSLDMRDALKAALKQHAGRIKAKSVLVAASPAAAADPVRLALEAAANKPKDLGFVFKPALDPESAAPLGGLADMRILLPAALASDPEFAVLVLSPDDILGSNRSPDSASVVLQRTLADGTIPILCVPPPRKAEEKDKIQNFLRSVSERAAQIGTPIVDLSLLSAKDAKGDPDYAKPAGLDKAAVLIVTVIKHIRESLAAP